MLKEVWPYILAALGLASAWGGMRSTTNDLSERLARVETRLEQATRDASRTRDALLAICGRLDVECR